MSVNQTQRQSGVGKGQKNSHEEAEPRDDKTALRLHQSLQFKIRNAMLSRCSSYHCVLTRADLPLFLWAHYVFQSPEPDPATMQMVYRPFINPKIRITTLILYKNDTTFALPPSQPRVASNAALSGKDVASPLSHLFVICLRSSHLRNAAFIFLGAPSSTTLLTGMNGLSSREAARMPYSWANISALRNVDDLEVAADPTMLSVKSARGTRTTSSVSIYIDLHKYL